MREFDLQGAFPRPRPLAEDFEDQTGAIDHLRLERAFEIALLHRRESAIHDDEAYVFFLDVTRNLLDLALAEKRRWFDRRQVDFKRAAHIEIDRLREPNRLFQTRFGTA